jgi:hypothetical protein
MGDHHPLDRPRKHARPNALHHLFLAEWTSAYPEARLYASPRLRRKRRDLSFNAELGDAPEPAWAGDKGRRRGDRTIVAANYREPRARRARHFPRKSRSHRIRRWMEADSNFGSRKDESG